MFLQDELTTKERFHNRIKKFRRSGKSKWIHHFWWFVHNCVAHPLIGVCPVTWTFWLHDYTSDRINLRFPA